MQKPNSVHDAAPLAQVHRAVAEARPPPEASPTKTRARSRSADSVRQANYKADLAAWEAAKEEHEKLIQKRQAKQKAAWKEARKKRAVPPPAAPRAALAPRPHS